MSRIVGIDLGTTNSLVATVDAGIPFVIADTDGHRLTPSVVHIPAANAEPIVGQDRATSRRDQAVRVKRSLDALNFFLADVRDGLGPYLAIYLLIEQRWDEANIGIVMSIAAAAGILAQTPAGALVDAIRTDLRRPSGNATTHVRGAACRSLRHHRKPVSKKEMMGVGDREMRHDPAKNCVTLPCSAIPR